MNSFSWILLGFLSIWVTTLSAALLSSKVLLTALPNSLDSLQNATVFAGVIGIPTLLCVLIQLWQVRHVEMAR